jgi:hypothetical protein
MEIIYFSIFNKLILGQKIYSHHFFSMIIITICILGLYILLIVEFVKGTEMELWRDIFFPTILNFLVYFIYCYHLVKAKYYIEKYFISPYELMVYLGTIGLLLLFIFEPFTYYISCDNIIMCSEGHFAGIILGFQQINDKKGVLISIGWVFFLFMTAFGLWLTVSYLSPAHFLTSDSIIALELNVMVDCYNPSMVLVNNPLFYILSIINIFACLIYNEIFILKVFNLNYNTRKEILKRQKVEQDLENELNEMADKDEDSLRNSFDSSIN